MVPFNWEYLHFRVSSQRCLKHFCDGLSVLDDLLVCIVPDIVSRVVTSPCDEASLEFILILSNKVKHGLQGNFVIEAAIVAPFACILNSLLVKYPGFRAVISTADWEIAGCCSSLSVLEINMRIRDLDGSNHCSWLSVKVNLLVEVVDEIIVFDNVWLTTQLLRYEIVEVELGDLRRLAEMKILIANSIWREDASSNSRQ